MKLLPFLYYTTFLITVAELRADVVVLTSEESLQLDIIRIDDQFLIAEHAILGDMSIPLQQIKYYEFDQHIQSNTSSPQLPPSQSVHHPSKPSMWDHTLHIGLGYLHAQHENLDINASYRGTLQDDTHEVMFGLEYRFSESNRTRTTNWLTSSLDNSWEQANGSWDFFTTVQFDWSEFQSWDQRIIGDLGIQFELLHIDDGDESFLLEGRLGGGVRKEFNSHQEDVIPEGLLGLTCEWSLDGLQSITADSTWYPDFDDTQHYRIVTNASWKIKIENLENLSFAVGLHHEFDSDVDVGIENAFLQVTAGVSYTF